MGQPDEDRWRAASRGPPDGDDHPDPRRPARGRPRLRCRPEGPDALRQRDRADADRVALARPHPAGDVDPLLGRSQARQEPGGHHGARGGVARRSAAGRRRADGPATPPRGSAILLSAEDDPSRTIVPRLRAAGADLDRVHILATMVESGFRASHRGPMPHGAGGERMPTLSAEDLEVIERRAAALGDCRLIVFDPISAYIGGRSNDVRRALAPLRDMAERLGAAVVLITHHSKQGASGTNGKYRVRGSIEYVGVCRANFLFLQDPDDPSGRRRLMLDNGGNLAPGNRHCPSSSATTAPRRSATGCRRPLTWTPTARWPVPSRPARSAHPADWPAATSAKQWLRGYLAGGTEAGEGVRASGAWVPVSPVPPSNGLASPWPSVACDRVSGKGACYNWCLPDAAIRGAPDVPDRRRRRPYFARRSCSGRSRRPYFARRSWSG